MGSLSTMASAWPPSGGLASTIPGRQARDKVVLADHGKGLERDLPGVFVQYYDTQVLAASPPPMVALGFHQRHRPDGQSTSTATDEELDTDSPVYRYDPSVAGRPARIRGHVLAVHLQGRGGIAGAGRLRQGARITFEKMLTYANHLACTPKRSRGAESRSATSRRRSRTSP